MFKNDHANFLSLAFFMGMLLGALLFVQMGSGITVHELLSENTTECVDFSMENDMFEEEHVTNPSGPNCTHAATKQMEGPMAGSCLRPYQLTVWQPPKLA